MKSTSIRHTKLAIESDGCHRKLKIRAVGEIVHFTHRRCNHSIISNGHTFSLHVSSINRTASIQLDTRTFLCFFFQLFLRRSLCNYRYFSRLCPQFNPSNPPYTFFRLRSRFLPFEHKVCGKIGLCFQTAAFFATRPVDSTIRSTTACPTSNVPSWTTMCLKR